MYIVIIIFSYMPQSEQSLLAGSLPSSLGCKHHIYVPAHRNCKENKSKTKDSFLESDMGVAQLLPLIF